eukprot:CAMPEP_0206240362 /NCGR_PEP_ID=MMETSP0047_2-20121206/15898_1 /ASSEMBLY_ACC=CAM_ASM_000192 /TAXON_ID=195065 /ORGANISM="Chroomonas mesostigmatica_cf, Strain CCMP1168" /LENGTH=62 /DNA_ID=CAMNT_0053665139 /DNA_START=199 /DNA_END=387 /DNA_ORIENTATION=+
MPGRGAYVPGVLAVLGVHGVHDVDRFAAEIVPGSHKVQTEAPAAEKEPAVQSEQNDDPAAGE